MRNLIIGLSLIFFISSIIITVKALIVSVNNVDVGQFSRGRHSETDVPGKDQQKDHEREEVTKKRKETLKENETLRNKIALLQGEKDRQEAEQYHSTVNLTEGVTGSESGSDRVAEQAGMQNDNAKKSPETITGNKQKASELIYAIQTGSFVEMKRAQTQFDQIAEGLNEKELINLRIEKIGKFYSVRLGKFISNSEAVKVLEYVKSVMPVSTIVKTRFIQERIEMMYRSQKVPGGAQPQQAQAESE